MLRNSRSLAGIVMAAITVCAVVLAIPSFAAEYPDRPIHLIVPFPAGSSVDLVARPLAQGLTDVLGQPIIVENRPGGGSIVGTAFVARSAPDGYTLLFAVGAHTSQASLSNLPYDPIRDFAAVTQVAASCGLVFLINSQLNAKTVADVVRLAKEAPGKLSYATLGYGSSTHIAGALFAAATGIDLVAVPYASSNLLTDFIANRTDIAFVSTVSARTPLKAGNARALAITGPRRCEMFPDLPTLRELGYKEFDREGYFGLVFPSGTPAAAIERIQQATVAVLKTPAMMAALNTSGLRAVGSSPNEFGALLRDDLVAQASIIKRLGIVKR